MLKFFFNTKALHNSPKWVKGFVFFFRYLISVLPIFILVMIGMHTSDNVTSFETMLAVWALIAWAESTPE